MIGGGLLGLEAAKAMMDIHEFGQIKVIEPFPYVLGRQVDPEGGAMVVEQVRDLGVDLILGKMVDTFLTHEYNNVTGVEFNNGESAEGACVCVAVSTHWMSMDLKSQL